MPSNWSGIDSSAIFASLWVAKPLRGGGGGEGVNKRIIREPNREGQVGVGDSWMARATPSYPGQPDHFDWYNSLVSWFIFCRHLSYFFSPPHEGSFYHLNRSNSIKIKEEPSFVLSSLNVLSCLCTIPKLETLIIYPAPDGLSRHLFVELSKGSPGIIFDCKTTIQKILLNNLLIIISYYDSWTMK
jgi:hypothetical protein